MNILYLSIAILVSLFIYWVIKSVINNFFLEEGEPPKSFRKKLEQLFKDSNMDWVSRWILAENLVGVLIGLCFIIIIVYKACVGDLHYPDANELSPVLFVLSLICAVPIGYGVLVLFVFTIALLSLFSLDVDAIVDFLFLGSDYSVDDEEVSIHWLRWIRSFFIEPKRKGVFWSLLRFVLRIVQFIILCIQFFLSFALSLFFLELAFS